MLTQPTTPAPPAPPTRPRFQSIPRVARIAPGLVLVGCAEPSVVESLRDVLRQDPSNRAGLVSAVKLHAKLDVLSSVPVFPFTVQVDDAVSAHREFLERTELDPRSDFPRMLLSYRDLRAVLPGDPHVSVSRSTKAYGRFTVIRIALAPVIESHVVNGMRSVNAQVFNGSLVSVAISQLPVEPDCEDVLVFEVENEVLTS